ncbi:MAG: O-antigen ligase family protein [Chloroflexota bacterium]
MKSRPHWLASWAAGALSLLLGAAVLTGNHALTAGITYGTNDAVATNLPANHYAVNVELDKLVRQSDIVRGLAMIHQAGFGYIRQVFAWNEIEISAKGDFYDHKNGKSAWEKYDRIVNDANAAGLQVIARLERPPDWSRQDNRYQTRPPDHFQDYGDFVSAFVQHFRGRIHYIQLWNEPNRFEDWGDQPVDPAAYTRLLQIGYRAAKQVDPSVVVISAALTPTTDCCVKNRPDPVYLQEMYNAGARGYFNVLGAQAYGLRTGPEVAASDFPLHLLAARRALIAAQNTNFGRVVLDRQVMVRNGDADKPVWVSEFGWNALPPGWRGDPSPWGSVTLRQQASYTVQAYQRARDEWPWLGMMAVWLFQDPTPAAKDPTQFFGLVNTEYQPRPVYTALARLTHAPALAGSGLHGPGDAAAGRAGPWQGGPGGGIISPVAGAQFSLRFRGQAATLHTERGPGMGIAYVTIDGSATYATDVPKDSAGRAALSLYAPATTPASIALASGLPLGTHQLTITVSGRSGAGAGTAVEIHSVAVGLSADERPLYFGGGLLALGLLLLAWNASAIVAGGLRRRCTFSQSGAGSAPKAISPETTALTPTPVPFSIVPPGAGQSRAGAAQASPGRIGLLPGNWVAALQPGSITWLALLPVGLALLYFGRPLPLVGLGALLFLAGAAARLDVALWSIPLTAPFYLEPKHIHGAALPLTEIGIGLCLAAALLRTAWQRRWPWRGTTFQWPALLFLAACTASVFAAEFPRYALREYRTDVLEPLIFFILILLARPRPKAMLQALLAGGVIVALVGLEQYATGHGIQAEGVRRLVAIYDSPDNVALYLGRLVPIAAAIALLAPLSLARRAAYAAVAGLMLLAVLLSFTRGAWVGVFLALLVVAAFAGRRWVAAALAGGVVAAVGISFVQAKRVRSILQFTPGSTGFTRLALWRSTVSMIRAHPWFGIGLDNFLYQYPRYMLPAAADEPDLSHPHNVVLDFWSRAGIFALAALVWLEVLFFAKAWRLAHAADTWTRAFAVGLLASMVDALAHGMVDNSYFLIDLSLVFWLSLGLLQVLEWRTPETEDAT